MTDSTTPSLPMIRTHFDYDGGTETTIVVWETLVRVTVRLLPSYRYWTAPTAGTIRGWVDDALEGTSRQRSGSRTEHDTHPGWLYTYPLTTTN